MTRVGALIVAAAVCFGLVGCGEEQSRSLDGSDPPSTSRSAEALELSCPSDKRQAANFDDFGMYEGSDTVTAEAAKLGQPEIDWAFVPGGDGDSASEVTVALLRADGTVWKHLVLTHDPDQGWKPYTFRSCAAPPRPERRGLQFEVKPGEPCPGAIKHPLQELDGRISAPVWLPDGPTASLGTMTGAWTCLGGDTPILTFGEVRISYESGWAGVNGDYKWTDFAEEWGGATEEISGLTAYVQGPSSSGHLGVVMMIVGDTLIRILGDGTVPLKELRAIASSIDLSEPDLRANPHPEVDPG